MAGLRENRPRSTPEVQMMSDRRAPLRPNHPLHLRAALVVMTAVVFLTSPLGVQPADAAGQTALDPAVSPRIVADPDTELVELGMKFSSSADGTVDAVRFHKSTANTGVHVGSLWDAAGTLLAQTTFRNETASGWQTSPLPQPVPISAGETYIVSYVAPAGRYSADPHGFDAPRTRGDLSVPAGAGVYEYGGGFPRNNYQNSNYYVDLVFTRPTTTPTASPGTPTQTPSPTQPPTPPLGTPRQIDGGPGFFDQFTDSLPSDPSFFPIGVWFESILNAGDIALDQNAGLNLYVELTANSDALLLGSDGPFAITSADMPGVKGRLTTDEADMWGGPGDAAWTGNTPGQGPICYPESHPCGFTIMDTLRRQIEPGTLVYANYGKGVTFWATDEEAARFVNAYQDVVSADNYWFTDPNICGASEGGRMIGGRPLPEAECRLAANYGWTVDRLRSLISPVGSRPVWAFVEVGHPFSEDSAPTITSSEIRAAVWSSVIHGARGVIYFNHNFGGDCQSQHVLRDECDPQVRPGVTALNRQIASLAPVLNSPFLDGVTSTGATVDHMTKVHDGYVYIFAASTQHAAQTASINSACLSGDEVSVVGEDRTLAASNGTFSDGFRDGNAVHIYRAPAVSQCTR